MRPDFLLHLSVTILLLFTLTKLVGWKKAVAITLTLQVGKEVFDFLMDSTNIDPIDWLGDMLGLVAWGLIYKLFNIKKIL